MNSKTLYVSDLDWTLLNGNQSLSDFTVNTLNNLSERGILFSYATARSYATAKIVTAGFKPQIPIIAYGGTFILDCNTGKNIVEHTFTTETAEVMLDLLIEHGLYPIVYSYIDGAERFSYFDCMKSPGMTSFLKAREGDERANFVSSRDQLCNGDIFHFTIIDAKEKLMPMLDILSPFCQALCYFDAYTDSYWLELLPKKATKASAVLELKSLLGCDRVVCFGDGLNDISMFEIADECYAVDNAVPELKKMATGIIESNDDDGVAKWLLRNVR